MAAAPSMPPTSTTKRRKGNQSAVRSSRTNPQTDVATSAAARPIRPTHVERRCHSPMVPIPTRPANGAARATA